MPIKNNVQLIVYPDSLGKDLVELHYVLRRYLSRAIGGIHLLPFYPSSADRGFAPLTYDTVDPVFGSWRDIDLIGEEFDLVIDFMVNHISRQSTYFLDYLEKGADSEFADMFLTFDKLSPDGEISDEDLAKVYTRKPRPPYTIVHRADGSKEKIWCTFDYEQIDLDWESPKTREVMRRYLIQLSRSPAKMIRMDAFAYSTFKLGTNCFFLEPQVWELLDWLGNYVAPFGVEILPEVHEHFRYHQKISEHGYWTYDFSLPMLMLHTLYHHSSHVLKQWLAICPHKQMTTLDTHDGIGVVDVQDLIDPDTLQKTLDVLDEKGANTRKIFSGPEYENLDIYQVNCTYYSALGANDDAYIAARAIQFFTPGIPQVYYVGLLAGENDIALVQHTKNGRDINRHNYSLEEIEGEIDKPVVKRLLRLMEFRNTCRAFEGRFVIEDSPDDQLKVSWTRMPFRAVLHVDLHSYMAHIDYYDEKRERMAEFTA
ncbi:Sucrose phosphorylase [Desulfosarcina cetonica]|uniref:sucrose phosphorylase n=1 Tax=Desulfosarcina cetonica TaxID=90730 RepID=UPI0006D15CF8|nr:sucrose phosphorylase [Desulfosarcina cetonica]VTR64084.1 Sucrose phosphorylase [Desulfosarcina cetonica]